MNSYDILIGMLKEDKNNLTNNCKIYNVYNDLIEKLNSCIDNKNSLSDIKEDLEVVIDNDIKEFITFIANILNSNVMISNDELNSKVKEYVDKLKSERDNRKEVTEYKENVKKIDKLLNIIDGGYNDDLEPLVNYIKESYINKRIDFFTYVNLSMYLVVKKSEVYNENSDEMEEVIIDENDEETYENIKERISTLFKENGYDYDLIDDNFKERIERLSKIENISKVLRFFKNYGLFPEDVNTYQNIISKIFIYYDEKAVNRVGEFLDNNKNTSLDMLLKMGTVFFSRKREYKVRNRSDKPGGISKGDVVYGNSLDFTLNVELYKRLLGKDTDYSMSDSDFMEREVFFSTPNEVLKKNIKLFKSYGIISFDEDDSLTDKNSFYRNSSCFAGRNVEYILDRCIESNLYDYIKKYKTILKGGKSTFTWYKIKRAYSLGESIRFNDSDVSSSRLKRIFTDDDESYNGISRTIKTNIYGKRYEVINQKLMTMGDLVRGNKSYPDPQGEPENYAEKEFLHFYKYKVYNITDIIDVVKRKSYINNFNYFREKLSSVNDVLRDYYSRDLKYYNGILDDSLISILDSPKNLSHNASINKGNGGLSYQIVVESKEWPKVEVTVSRPKVLKICSLLKKENLWIDERSSYDEIVALVLVTITKDSVLSEAEMEALKYVSKVIANVLYNGANKNKGVIK